MKKFWFVEMYTKIQLSLLYIHHCTQIRIYHVTIPGTFVEVELAENAPLFKEGFVLRKNIMEGPHKKGTTHTVYAKISWVTNFACLKQLFTFSVLGKPCGH